MTTHTKPLAERLRHASTTASNDDLSKPGTEKRQRHADRVAVMLEAADDLDAKDALLREAAEVLRPFAEAYKAHDDPGISDLDNEQPVAWHVPLGVFRRARSLLHKLTEATKP